MAAATSPSASATDMPSAGRTPSRYRPVDQLEGIEAADSDNDTEFGKSPPEPLVRRHDTRFRNATYILSVLLVILLSSNLYSTLPYSFHGDGFILGSGSDDCPCSKPRPPQYFQTSPELWPGPTATGRPAFMAQTRAFNPTGTYVPNEPLQTSIPIEGMKSGNDSIFKMMGYLSPYSPSPGFGVDEYPMPEGADIVQVQMLSRHGARYPTSNADVIKLGKRLSEAGEGFKPKDDLAFLKDWKYQLGLEILVPKGRQELFDSGRLPRSIPIGVYSRRPRYTPQLHVWEAVQPKEQDHCPHNGMQGYYDIESHIVT